MPGTKNVSAALVTTLLLALAAVGCGDDSGGTGTGAGGGGTATITKEEALAGACDSERADENTTCTGTAEYVSCIETACAAGYTMCLGANYKTGDSTGSPCEAYMKCLNTATDKCSCTQDSTCLDCLTNNVGSCAATASCTLPMCTMNAAAGAGSGGGAGTGAGGKTCAELEACCAGQPDSTKTTCLQAASAWKAAGAQGDAACSAAYSSFCPGG